MNNWQNRWKALWNPDMYHGWGKTNNYFEGWYIKIVDPTEQFVFAIIPGISKGKDGDEHAFIQVLDGVQGKASYHRFEAADFQPSADTFAVRLGNNFFLAENIELDLPELKGHLRFQNLYRWPKMLGAPGIMGWYSFMPFMECYHGVVSVHHQIEGQLKVNGQLQTFDGGLGYMEKDWGRSFPSSWIWLQTNHFQTAQRVSCMASVARIPWLGNHFIGCIVGFLLGDKLYRFATYTGAKMKAELFDDRVELGFKDAKNTLEIRAFKAPGGSLLSPLSGNMTGKVNESMQARVEVRLFAGEQLLFEGTGRNAGLEVAGPVEELLTNRWRR
ncbi:MAG: tocopherol cyclase family protein [Saprospiraceae bacterium]|nr:tocopherol cyclase family protein [Saprospiraceae bacterium]